MWRGEEAVSGGEESFRVGLLGHGTVGAAFEELLPRHADRVQRITGLRPELSGILTRSSGSFDDLLERSHLIVELMGGIEPAREYVLRAMRAGRHVVTANKQLLSQHGEELWEVARQEGVQLRFEGSVAGVVPVIRVLQESLSGATIDRVHGIVNGTTNFILTRMESGAPYTDALAEAQRLGYAEADPTDDVSGADAAAKMAILATVAFGTRVTLDDVWHTGIEEITPLHMRAANELDMAVRLVGAATLVDGRYDVRVQPAFVDRHHPLAGVEGPFNAVMLQGDAIREITLEGPGAGGPETASAVVSDMISVIGTTGTGFLQNDACWRELERLPHGDVVSPFYVHLEVDDRPGVLADVARRLSVHEVSVARLVQHETGEGTAALHIVLHECRSGALSDALVEIAQLPGTRQRPTALPVISDRGVPGLGWA